MSVATDMQTDFSASLLEDIGEDLVYHPTGGTPRTIKGIVRRLTSDVKGITRTLPARITVLNNATTGILSSAFNAGLDKIDVPPRRGDTAITCETMRIISHSEASITLEAH
jgi:hypothetical protein